METRRSLFLWLSFFAGLVVFCQWRVNAHFQWRYPALNELVPTEHLAEDLGVLAMGSHRLAADVAYIQFLQYYGTPENEEEKEAPGHFHDMSAGKYPRLKELAIRNLRLDPFFNAAVLTGAGALAFNQNRLDEALDLLNEAIQRDPVFYRYHLYAAAILYRNRGQDQRLLETLEEAARYSDCPTLLKFVLGNLYKKYGRIKEAAAIFLQVMETAPTQAERDDARNRLMKLTGEGKKDVETPRQKLL